MAKMKEHQKTHSIKVFVSPEVKVYMCYVYNYINYLEIESSGRNFTNKRLNFFLSKRKFQMPFPG